MAATARVMISLCVRVRYWLGRGLVYMPLALSLSIYIIPLFTLSSIYSTNASGVEQMPETSNSNET